ncbi:hypothetical protein KIF53_02395 [Chromobacterium subtsugae]|mgnify:CR=1 FL=1|uniref:Lipoprotein n=2 Tax=Chromobacterium subtsugae TaxID=251747 RepID=A0ABS7F8S4_9NEIS|nr:MULTISPECIES: hypothetical protein [Chromobacterium]KUM03119.1 hypothetical protein Cv017_21285 [Chromobacterium subtsugae]KZE86544.1 hypothetical protein AWB61_15035 [Chromobacterium sp. F49]MBW7564988.1 hypothetical protein [Chromobacterium subtsugae]MBW8286485.1 hypothetical protein [Chromobacterium subtsugae]WSE91472.1 hypothetical protein U6115_21805 [Chromobacterium subtsugae]
MTPPVFPRRWLPLLWLPLLSACALRPPAAPVRYCPGGDALLIALDWPDEALRQRWQAYEACDSYRLLRILRANRAEPGRLASELDKLLADKSLSPASAALARLQLRQAQTQFRLQDQNEHQQQQLRDQQKRIDDQAAKLDALRRLELDLPKPNGLSEGSKR